MKKLYIILTIFLLVATNHLKAQNDTIYFWKTGTMLQKRSIKLMDLDSITFRRPVTGSSTYKEGSVFCASGPTVIVNVMNPITGKIWMDRNLGASQVATSLTDPLAYGDLYQWGRRSDGHQCRNSATISALSSTDQPPYGSFITTNSDWRSSQNINLWQGANGINNPCPIGYRLPTETELDAERASWTSQNQTGAFASPLKLPLAGTRHSSDGLTYGATGIGFYWGSTIKDNVYSGGLFYSSTGVNTGRADRGDGNSVRCIKN